MKKMFSLLLALSLPLACLSGCGERERAGGSSEMIEFEAQTWTLTFSGAERSPEGLAARRFADGVYEATNGAVTVALLPLFGDSGGDGWTGLQDVAGGSISLGIYSSLTCQQLDSRLGVVSLPFLFSSEAEADAALDGSGGQALGEILSEYGLFCAGIGEEGFRCPTNNQRPIVSPEDLQGLDIRVADSDIIQEAYRLWGAQCITADWPLVFTALRTGKYDGQEVPLITADAASVQSVQKYLTRWTGIYGCLYFCMNQELYDGLSPALQEIVEQCGRDAMDFQRENSRQMESEILSSWRKDKVAITELTEEEAAVFRELAQPCYDHFSLTDSTGLLSIFTGEAAET